MRCPWCHNPEGISAAPQIVVNPTRCLSCSLCAEACPQGDADHRSTACDTCGSCAEACPSAARNLVGRRWTLDEVRDVVLRDRVFYDNAEGGVTFSGGEPLSQPDFLVACLRACREAGVHTALDTCGLAPVDDALAAAEWADLILFDLKILEPGDHLRVLGAPLEPILDNLDALTDRGRRLWLRLPVIPGITDTEDNLERLRELVAGRPGIEKLCLLPYHANGAAKHLNITHSYSLDHLETPSDQRMHRIAAHLEDLDFEIAIGG